MQNAFSIADAFNMIDCLPDDVLMMLVYGLLKIEDRIALVISCKAVLQACGGFDTTEGRISANGGDLHWSREVRKAGFRPPVSIAGMRAIYFDIKAQRCAACDVLITHRTGCIVSDGNTCHGVHLASCVRCGPLVHVRSILGMQIMPAVPRVFGGFVCRRKFQAAMERCHEARTRGQIGMNTAQVKAALHMTGMSPQRVDAAMTGSKALDMYINTNGRDIAGLDATVLSICRRHWLHNYTWLACACLICGTPFNDQSKDDVYRHVLTSYGGYPSKWPWTVRVGEEQQNHRERQQLADTMLTFYAKKMMLESLFHRMVRNELCWLADHFWFSKIRDVIRQQRTNALGREPFPCKSYVPYTTFVLAPCPSHSRVTQLVLHAEFVGGYRMRRCDSHMTFTIL